MTNVTINVIIKYITESGVFMLFLSRDNIVFTLLMFCRKPKIYAGQNHNKLGYLENSANKIKKFNKRWLIPFY